MPVCIFIYLFIYLLIYLFFKEGKAFLLVKNSYTEIFLALLSCTHVLRPILIHL
jgi:hypothetical protein